MLKELVTVESMADVLSHALEDLQPAIYTSPSGRVLEVVPRVDDAKMVYIVNGDLPVASISISIMGDNECREYHVRGYTATGKQAWGKVGSFSVHHELFYAVEEVMKLAVSFLLRGRFLSWYKEEVSDLPNEP